MSPKKRKTAHDGAERGSLVTASSDGSETFTFFYGHDSKLGNFVESKFTLDNRQFNCTEQYFHFKKAEHFEDEEMMKAILASESPAEQKKLGRQVRGYDETEWNSVGLKYMKEGLTAKFEQNQELRAILFGTIGTTLVEASPRDRKWGIGIGLTNPNIADRKAWKGKNLLGTVLMEVRDFLSSKDEFKNELPFKN